jgi:hypothetical protein
LSRGKTGTHFSGSCPRRRAAQNPRLPNGAIQPPGANSPLDKTWGQRHFAPFKRTWITTTIRTAFVIYVSDLSFIASQYLDRYIVLSHFVFGIAACWRLFSLLVGCKRAVSTFVSIAVFQIQRPRLVKAHHNGGVPVHLPLTSSFLKTTTWATAVQCSNRMRVRYIAAVSEAAPL